MKKLYREGSIRSGVKQAGGMVLGLILATLSGYADRTVYVSLTGTNNSPYINWAEAATNILWAVTVATNGDTVLVSNGVYVLTNTISLTKGITLRNFSTNPADTVLDGNLSCRCVSMTNYILLSVFLIASIACQASAIDAEKYLQSVAGVPVIVVIGKHMVAIVYDHRHIYFVSGV